MEIVLTDVAVAVRDTFAIPVFVTVAVTVTNTVDGTKVVVCFTTEVLVTVVLIVLVLRAYGVMRHEQLAETRLAG